MANRSRFKLEILCYDRFDKIFPYTLCNFAQYMGACEGVYVREGQSLEKED